MKCEICDSEFEYDEGKIYDDETFCCFECADELETQSINWRIRNEWWNNIFREENRRFHN